MKLHRTLNRDSGEVGAVHIAGIMVFLLGLALLSAGWKEAVCVAAVMFVLRVATRTL